jgi:hypothetical protein
LVAIVVAVMAVMWFSSHQPVTQVEAIPTETTIQSDPTEIDPQSAGYTCDAYDDYVICSSDQKGVYDTYVCPARFDETNPDTRWYDMPRDGSCFNLTRKGR